MLGLYVRQVNRKSYRLHDCIVLLSESYIPIYERLIGKVVNNVYAIPNPMPKICSKIPIEQKNNEILFVGHLTNVKRVDRLLTIWFKIQNRLKNWSLVIVGDGPERKYLESFVLENNLERVHFKGYVKSIDYIDSAKVLCLVSNFEGLPTVFLEAMRLGVIPIGYNTFPAICDIIDNGKNGYIIPFENEELYIKVLLDIATDDLLRKKLAEKAKLKSEEFTIKNVAMRWIEIICRLDLK